MTHHSPKPEWLKQKLPQGAAYGRTSRLLRRQGLHTVCEEALCPNRFECFSQGTATFLLMGPNCSRQCRFCSIGHPPSGQPDPLEGDKIAASAAELGLNYVVLTSVTRDDLTDGGASQFVAAIAALNKRIEDVSRTEVLIPDFQGDSQALATVLAAGPCILNHNIETVPRLYSQARPQADYERSLYVLSESQKLAPEVPRKSGLMLGLGETEQEIGQTLQHLRKHHCDVLTMGQYLRPGKEQLPVTRYVTPEEFATWEQEAYRLGFTAVASGPFVRSSYQAQHMWQLTQNKVQA